MTTPAHEVVHLAGLQDAAVEKFNLTAEEQAKVDAELKGQIKKDGKPVSKGEHDKTIEDLIEDYSKNRLNSYARPRDHLLSTINEKIVNDYFMNKRKCP